MGSIIESGFINLIDTGIKYDVLVGDKKIKSIIVDPDLKNPKDYVQVHVEEGKHIILVSKYRLGLDEEVKKLGEKLNLKLENTAIEQSSGRGYIGYINHKQALDINENLGGFTLSPKYFLDFLRTLKSGNAKDGLDEKIDPDELDTLYNEIMEIRAPYRAEWIDASFAKNNGQQYISYPKINLNNQIERVTEILDIQTLMENKHKGLEPENLGISLENLLYGSTSQGLPNKDISSGNLHFYCPVENKFAWFVLSSDAAYLGFDSESFTIDEDIGVRKARLAKSYVNY